MVIKRSGDDTDLGTRVDQETVTDKLVGDLKEAAY